MNDITSREEDQMQLDTDLYGEDMEEVTLEDMPQEAFLRFVVEGQNLVDYIPDGKLDEISQEVTERYNIDKESMSGWLSAMEKGIDLAKMKKEDKSYPHEHASNIKYPLVTGAALQYNARAYPAIVPSGDPIQCQVHGNDPQGTKAARGERVGSYGSFQLKSQNPRWESDTDRMTFIGPIVGTVFRKYWYDPGEQTQKSKLCVPGKVIVNNDVSSLEDMPAITEEFELYMWQIEERRRDGRFSAQEFDEEEYLDSNKTQDFIEQFTRIDLDDDGYQEPYVVTVHKESGNVVRIVAAFDMEDVHLNRMEDGEVEVVAIKPSMCYIDFPFLPSFDGGFMSYGLGMLLGDISDSINTALNMLVDSAHYSMLGGGWVGAKDFRVKGASTRFSPGEWKQTNFRGTDIRNGIVPMQYPEPSPVMFQLLGLLIDAGRELASTSNVMTGDAANANMPVGTVMALIEQGMQVFTASYKRIYRSLKKEYALLCKMNARYLPAQVYSQFFDEIDESGHPVIFDPAVDFNLRDMDITPVADPKSVTDMQKMARAQLVYDMSLNGKVDDAEAIKRVLEAASIENVEELIPQPNPMDAQIAEFQMLSARVGLQAQVADINKKMADTQASLAKAAKDVASAESEEMGRNMQDYLKELEAMKKELEIGQQRLGGMAGSSGNGMAAQPVSTTPRVQQAASAGLPMGEGG